MFTRIRDARLHAKELLFAKEQFEKHVADGIELDEAADLTLTATQKKFSRSINIEQIMAIIAFIQQLMALFASKATIVLLALTLTALAAEPSLACHGRLVGSRLEARRSGSCGVATKTRQAPWVNARRSGTRRTALRTPRVRLSGACRS